jgi:hypothetical protein
MPTAPLLSKLLAVCLGSLSLPHAPPRRSLLVLSAAAGDAGVEDRYKKYCDITATDFFWGMGHVLSRAYGSHPQVTLTPWTLPRLRSSNVNRR